jgi:hypothetical protein
VEARGEDTSKRGRDRAGQDSFLDSLQFGFSRARKYAANIAVTDFEGWMKSSLLQSIWILLNPFEEWPVRICKIFPSLFSALV